MENNLSQIWIVAQRLDREMLDTATFAAIAAFIESFDVNVSDEVLQEYFLAFEQDYLNEELLTVPELSPRELKVTDFMSTEVLTVESELSLRKLCARLAQRMVSGFPVVDRSGKLIGVVSSSEVVRVLAENREVEELTVGDIMTRCFITARGDSSLVEVLHLMLDFRLHRAVVVDGEERPVGIVTTIDAARALKMLLSERRDSVCPERELLFLN